MEKQEKLDNYFEKESPWKEGIQRLRQLLSTTELQEDWKWNFPTYTLQGKNVLAIASHKTHFGLWFFQGVFLKDEKGLLRNAQEGKTKAMRSFYYDSLDALDEEAIISYSLEAIENAKAGKEIKPKRNTKALKTPKELNDAFKKEAKLKVAFEKLTPGKQREYADHIAGAKQEATRLRRLEKCIPMILDGAGLHDKYKNC